VVRHEEAAIARGVAVDPVYPSTTTAAGGTSMASAGSRQQSLDISHAAYSAVVACNESMAPANYLISRQQSCQTARDIIARININTGCAEKLNPIFFTLIH